MARDTRERTGIASDAGTSGGNKRDPLLGLAVGLAVLTLLAACSSNNNSSGNKNNLPAPAVQQSTQPSGAAGGSVTGGVRTPTPAVGAATRAATPATAASPAAAAASGGGSYGTITIEAGKPLTIGISTSLSGGTATLGIPIAQGVELAVAQKGTIKGHQVVAQRQDDGCGSQGSVAAANKFISDPSVVGVVGPMCSSGCVPAEQVDNEKHIADISPSCTAPNVTAQGFDDILRTTPSDSVQGLGQAQFVKEEIKASKAFLINDQSIYAKALEDLFKKNYQDNDHKIVGDEAIKVGDTDFSAIVSKVQASGADMVCFYGFIPEATLFIQQLRKAGSKIPFLGDDGTKDVDGFITKAQGAADGAYVSNTSAGTTDATAKFNADYQAKYNAPPGIYADTAYDAANVLMATIDSVGQDQGGKLVIDKKALIDALHKANFSGVTGTISFAANGDRNGGQTVVSQVQNGQFVALKTYGP